MFKEFFDPEYNEFESPVIEGISKTYKKITFFCALAHAGYFLLFRLAGIDIMQMFNVLSVTIYVVLTFFPFQNAAPIIVSIFHVEVTLHAALSIILLGWGYGFDYILICLITLMYIPTYKRKYIPYIFGIIEMGIFLILKIYCHYNDAFIVIQSKTIRDIFMIFNTLACFIAIFLLSLLNNASNSFFQYILAKKNRTLQKEAIFDSLTNLYNRRYMEGRLNSAVIKRDKSGKAFCIAIGDIDDFKFINDNYSHNCGDYVLKEIGKIFRNQIRASDAVCRWGGEEFLFMFDESETNNAYLILERIRRIIEENEFYFEGKKIRVTMTFGVAKCELKTPFDATIEQADTNLYKGKRSGKNKVVS